MPSSPNRALQKSIEYISGYLTLGMVKDAREELERICPFDRGLPEAMEAQMAILYASESWKELEQTARSYTQSDPNQMQGWLSLAFALRRTRGVPDARDLLLAVDARFGATVAVLHFNLACYHCLLHETELAIVRLRRAIKLDPNLKTTALEDQDLKPLWGLVGDL